MKKFFAAIVDSLSDGILLTQKDEVVLYCNPAAEKMMGQKSPFSVFPQLRDTDLLSQLPLEFSFEQTVPHEASRWYIVTVRETTMESRPNETFLLIQLRDVTEQKEEDAQREYFLNIAGHEIKNPLATVRAVSQTLERKIARQTSEESTTQIRKIIGKTDLITHLVNELMDIQRLQTGHLAFYDEVILPSAVLEECLQDIRRMFPQVTFAQEGEWSEFGEIDPQRLKQVILSLLVNAAKHTPAGKGVNLKAQSTSKNLELQILDSGPFINPDEQEKIFALTYRPQDGHPEHRPGLGPGLFLSRVIVEHYGGHISAHPPVGHSGGFFQIVLPRRQSSR